MCAASGKCEHNLANKDPKVQKEKERNTFWNQIMQVETKYMFDGNLRTKWSYHVYVPIKN